MKQTLRGLLSTIMMLALLVAGGTPAVADPDKDEAHGKEHRRSSGRGRGDQKDHSYFHQHGYANLGIPEGHLPPPGACRIWYPGKPAGHQPPPGKCGRVRRRVPAGAWLIQRPGDNPQHVDVAVYDASRPGIVVSIGIFEAQTGDFIQIRPR